MPDNTFASFLDFSDEKEPNVPYQWFYRHFPNPRSTAVDELVETYQKLLKQASKAIESAQDCETDNVPGAACSHNVILTSRWIVVIPRRRASVRNESGANATGMLGYIAVSSQDDIDNWTNQGLCHLLSQLGVPK